MQEWKKLKEQLVYDGYRKIIRRTFTLPSGQSSNYDIVHTNGSVAVLAITPDNKIICFKQFRPGPEEALYELPGGGIDSNEEPQKAAERELFEETGCRAEITSLGSYCRDAYTSGYSYIFIGTNAKIIEEVVPADNEPGEIVLLSLDEFKEKLFAGQMSDTTTGYAGLHHLGLL